jgi:hypothetical protein
MILAAMLLSCTSKAPARPDPVERRSSDPVIPNNRPGPEAVANNEPEANPQPADERRDDPDGAIDAGAQGPGWYCWREGVLCKRTLAACRAKIPAGACVFTRQAWCFTIESSPPSRRTPVTVDLCHLREAFCEGHRNDMLRYFTEPYPISLKMHAKTGCFPVP